MQSLKAGLNEGETLKSRRKSSKNWKQVWKVLERLWRRWGESSEFGEAVETKTTTIKKEQY